MKKLLLAMLAVFAISASVSAWPDSTNSVNVEIGVQKSVLWKIPQGEYSALVANYQIDGTNTTLTNFTGSYLYQVRGMGDDWYEITGTVSEANGTLTVQWGPPHDPGNLKYFGWMSVVTGTNPTYRCAADIEMIKTPGFNPDATELGIYARESDPVFTNWLATNTPSANYTNLFTGSGTTGSVSSGSSDTNKFLMADGTWQAPSGSGDMMKTTYDINNNGIVDTSDALISWLATNAYIKTESDPVHVAWLLTNAYVKVEVDGVFTNWLATNTPSANYTNLFAGSGTTGSVGSVAGDAGKYLKANGTWDTPGGGGDMLKATYDTDANDIVDTSDALTNWIATNALQQTAINASATTNTTQSAGIAANLATNAAQEIAIGLNTAKYTYPIADSNKVAGVEALADVTDTANVSAAGAGMLASNQTFTGTNTLSDTVILEGLSKFIGGVGGTWFSSPDELTYIALGDGAVSVIVANEASVGLASKVLYDDGAAGIWQSEGAATTSLEIVNYQTMDAQQYHDAGSLTNELWSFAYTDPLPSNAVMNIVRSGSTRRASTVTDYATRCTTGTVIFDIVKWGNTTNALENYDVIVTGVVSSTTHSNVTGLALAYAAGTQIGTVVTNGTCTNLFVEILGTTP